MRYASKVDANQAQIVEELRKLGFDVDVISREKRMYDIIVSGIPVWSLRVVAVRVEIKANNREPFTPYEQAYWQAQRHGDNLIRATCTEEILEWFSR